MNTDVSSVTHTNAFINLNGVPYLLGEYVDRETFQQIDPSIIESSINIDQTEAMRAIIDICINDIIKDSNGTLKPIGNSTQIESVQNLIANQKLKMESKLPVLRKGILIRVNYRLENAVTGIIIRSAQETFHINERNLFILINSGNINDNFIIANFSSTLVSTINEFTHGTVPMNLRITNVQLAYEYVKVNPVIPKVTSSIVGYPVENYNMCEYPDPYACRPCCNMSEADMYNYHKQMQCQHRIGDPYIGKPNQYVIPDSWYAFSRFYHFDEGGQTAILHENEIYDNATKVMEMQCGNVQVNRTFRINPGHRIIWKFTIWKNDLIVVNDTTTICQILQAPIGSPTYPLTFSNTQQNNQCSCGQQPQYNPPICPPPPPPMSGPSTTDYAQNEAINTLLTTLHDLQLKLKELTGDEEEVTDPSLLPTGPTPPLKPNCDCGTDHSAEIANITAMIAAIQGQIQVLEEKQARDDARPDVTLITEDDILEAVNNADDATRVDL